MNLEQLGPIIGPILFIIITLASCLLLGFKILEKRSQKKNSGSTRQLRIEETPGHAQVCQDNTKIITKLETSHDFIVQSVGEIKTSIEKI